MSAGANTLQVANIATKVRTPTYTGIDRAAGITKILRTPDLPRRARHAVDIIRRVYVYLRILAVSRLYSREGCLA